MKSKVYNKAEEYNISSYTDCVYITHDEVLCLANLLKTCIRWIVALDYYHETFNIEFLEIAVEERQKLDTFLTSNQVEDFLLLEKKIVDPFWQYEKDIEAKIKNSYQFSIEEIDDFMWRRSSDSLLYARLTSYFYPISENTIYLLHFTQYLEDIEDCKEDYVEDLESGQANLFFLHMLSNGIKYENFPKSI